MPEQHEANSLLPDLPLSPSIDHRPSLPARAAPTAEPVARLAIHSLQLNNFKSYGGTVCVGPFHKNFSAIVGPNGSGKSNVIDAMLFVFGRPAKHLRHSKLAELLHNSATYPNVSSATVTVYFHEIVDTGDGDDDYTVLTNSAFSVARTAYRNNTSKYFVSGREVKRKEVVDLLKSKGVDLDNNRFLILQGEVEQISLMKPKSINAHDTGLLEYLEDIIGSNRHIADINRTAADVEALNEERGHKLQRVKAAEQERDALESAKNEAEDYLDKERDLMNKKVKLNRCGQAETSESLAKHRDEHAQAKAKVDGFKAEVQEKETAVTELEKTFKVTQKQETAAVKVLNNAKEAYAEFERKDIKLREDMKALKANHKKMHATAEREGDRIEENDKKLKMYEKEKGVAERAITTAEEEMAEAQAAFDKTRDKAKQLTQPIRAELEQKQKEQLPFSQAINEARKTLQVNQAELTILDDKLSAPAKSLSDAHETLHALQTEDLPQATDKLNSLTAQCDAQKQQAAQLYDDVAKRRTDLASMSDKCSAMRRRIEQARAAREFANTRSRLHSAVLTAARNKRLHGVVGRLGDLASIDDRYATAVSAAAGANLDCIVVHTADNAQACIQFLRTENLGRATFIILEKVHYLQQSIEAGRRNTNWQGRRLFDFLDIPNEQNYTALYYALRDTLVADNLEEARRMAFTPQRNNRVVTLAGELIEATGAMTGGGKGPTTKYRLGDGSNGRSTGDSDNNELSDNEFRKLCDDTERMRQDIQHGHRDIDRLEQDKRQAEAQVERLQVEISKCNAEVTSLHSRIATMNDQTIPALQRAADERAALVQAGKCADTKRRMQLDKKVKESETKLRDAKAACTDIERDIAALQERIIKAGGSQLDSAKKKLENQRKHLSELKSNAATAKSRMAAAKKAKGKALHAKETAEKGVEEMETDLAAKKTESEDMLEEAVVVTEQIKEAEGVHQEWAEKLEVIQKDFAEVKGSLKSLRRKEVSLIEAADALKRAVNQDGQYLKALKKQEKGLQAKLKKLSLSSLVAPPLAGSVAAADAAQEEEDGDDVELVDDMQGVEDNEEGGDQIDVVEEDSNTGGADGDDEIQPAQNADNNNKDAEAEDGPSDQNKQAKKDKSAEHSSPWLLSPADKQRMETEVAALESELAGLSPNVGAIAEYATKDREYGAQVHGLDGVTARRDAARRECDRLRKARLDEFMSGFSVITLKLKELYQMITLGGDAELELVDSLDPFSEGIVFSVRPPKKSWKNICNLSGGEKTLSSLALVFALHHFKPTPLYFLDEIDAALDFKNVSIVGNYVKERTKDAQFIIISLRNNMFELADRLVGIYKTNHTTKSVTVNPNAFQMPAVGAAGGEMTMATHIEQTTS